MTLGSLTCSHTPCKRAVVGVRVREDLVTVEAEVGVMRFEDGGRGHQLRNPGGC